MLISVDAGKDTTKACIKKDGEWITKSFRSRIHDLSKGDIIESSEDHRIKLPEGSFIVGESGTKQEYTTSKTDLVNKICQYTAITMFIEPNTLTKVDLVTGCPASIYRNAMLRDKYIANIKGDGQVTITVDGSTYLFEFNSITVRPEGAGILMLKPELFKDKNTLIIDIGGQNFNATVYNKLKIDPNKMFTKNAGGISIEQNLINTFETLGIENIDNNIIRDAIIKGELVNDIISIEETAKIIDDEINLYIETELVDELNKNGVNPGLFNKVFIGGTSYTLKEQLNKHFKNATFMDSLKDSQFANSKGFYKMLEGRVE